MEKEYKINNDEYYYNIIRNNLKKIRKKHKYTQQDVADMIDCSRQYICDVENDKRYKHISIALLGRIADALDVDIKEFFEK